MMVRKLSSSSPIAAASRALRLRRRRSPRLLEPSNERQLLRWRGAGNDVDSPETLQILARGHLFPLVARDHARIGPVQTDLGRDRARRDRVGARDHDRVYARGVAGANGFGHGTPHDNGAKSTGWRTVRPTGWGEDAAPRPALGRPNGDFMATIRRAAPGCAGPSVKHVRVANQPGRPVDKGAPVVPAR
jgi:hypothetical protein